MTADDREMLNRINTYADQVLSDIDPQKTQVSFQLDKLRPLLEQIAAEKGISIEDIFIQYMDLASEASVERERKFRSELGNPSPYGDISN